MALHDWTALFWYAIMFALHVVAFGLVAQLSRRKARNQPSLNAREQLIASTETADGPAASTEPPHASASAAGEASPLVPTLVPLPLPQSETSSRAASLLPSSTAPAAGGVQRWVDAIFDTGLDMHGPS